MNRLLFLLLLTLTGWLNSFGNPLSNGEYFIKINQTGKYLAIAGAAKDNGSRMIQRDNEYKQHFMFILRHLGSNVYTLKAKHSGKFLSTEGAPARGAKIIQWDWLGQDNQKWVILPHASGKGYVMSCFQNNMRMIMQHWNSTVTPTNGAYFFLNDEVAMTPMILDFKKNEVDDTNATTVWRGFPKETPAVTPTQQDITDGVYRIKVNQTGKCLAIENVSTENGARLVQWDYVNQANHQFVVTKRSDGYYEISAIHSQRYVSAAGNNKADGTAIIQWDYANQEYCRWRIYYTTQRPNPGWVIQHANSSPIQLQGGVDTPGNGQPFVLKQQQRQDAHDYDAVQTFSFEKIKDPRTMIKKAVGGEVIKKQ